MNNFFNRIHPVKDFFLNLAQKEFRVFMVVFFVVTTGWLFVIISSNVKDGSTQKFDESIIELFRQPGDKSKPIGNEEISNSVRDITALGSGTVLFIITAGVAGFLILRKDYHSLLMVLFAVIGGALIDMWFKDLFGRERPLLVYRLVQANSLSFPSGHSMMSAVVYLSLAVLVSRILIRRIMRLYVIITALFLSLIIGLSRIYLGVHYPTDVLGGWTLGLFWAGICWFVQYYTERVFNKK
jgi:undecaprenyl-diphosphatase